MIPILYEKTEIHFASNGLCRLPDCISCYVEEERNGIYECTFEYPVTGVNYDKIQEGRIIAVTHDENGDVQPFDIYASGKPINGVVTYYARHISYRLNELVVKPYEASSCAQAVDLINSKTVTSNPFTFWTDKETLGTFINDVPRNIRNMLGGEENSLLDVYGTAEYEFDKFVVKMHSQRGQDTDVQIRYGKNLVNYDEDLTYEDSYNGVVPYWVGEVEVNEETVTQIVTLPEWYIDTEESVPSGRMVLQPLDLSAEFEEKPTVNELRSLATSKINDNEIWNPVQTIKVDFVQLWQTEEYKNFAPLERVKLCDTVGVFVPMYNKALRAKVIKVTWNVLLDRYDEMELGDKPQTYYNVIRKDFDSKVAGIEVGLNSISYDLSAAVTQLTDHIEDLQNQIDGEVTAWFYSADPSMNTPPVTTDPSNPDQTGWDTDEKKQRHVGDTYTNVSTGNSWRFAYYNSAYSWIRISDSDVQRALELAGAAQATADSKRRVFVDTPVIPNVAPDGYDVGDLWVQGVNGDIMRCVTAKTSSGTYDADDWVKASKYTSDASFNAWVLGDFATTVSQLETGIKDAKVETFYGTTDPATSWVTPEQKEEHEGDLWYNSLSSVQKYYRYTKNSQNQYVWEEIKATPPTEVFNEINGKSTIYTNTSQNPPANAQTGDLWFKGLTDPILTYINGQWVEYNKYIDATTAQNKADTAENNAKAYTDTRESAITSAYSNAIATATELLRGGTGGYVITTVNASGKPIELLIADNIDLNQAVNVWRWNQNGIGYSNTGYNGTYKSAWTIAGAFNADFITAGTLNANIIKAGVLSDVNNNTNFNLATGALNISKGSISLGLLIFFLFFIFKQIERDFFF